MERKKAKEYIYCRLGHKFRSGFVVELQLIKYVSSYQLVLKPHSSLLLCSSSVKVFSIFRSQKDSGHVSTSANNKKWQNWSRFELLLHTWDRTQHLDIHD